MNDQMFERATRAYFRRCARCGALYEQPNYNLSSVTTTSVTLRNARGVLGRFTILGGRLRWKERRT